MARPRGYLSRQLADEQLGEVGLPVVIGVAGRSGGVRHAGAPTGGFEGSLHILPWKGERNRLLSDNNVMSSREAGKRDGFELAR